MRTTCRFDKGMRNGMTPKKESPNGFPLRETLGSFPKLKVLRCPSLLSTSKTKRTEFWMPLVLAVFRGCSSRRQAETPGNKPKSPLADGPALFQTFWFPLQQLYKQRAPCLAHHAATSPGPQKNTT